MEKFITAILGIALAMNFSACSKEEGEGKNKEEDKVEASEYITEEYCYIPSTKEEKEEIKEYARQKKLAEKWEARAENLMDFFNMKAVMTYKPFKDANFNAMSPSESQDMQAKMMEAQKSLVSNYGKIFVEKMKKVEEGFNKDCPDYAGSPEFQNALNMMNQLEGMLNQMGSGPAANEAAETPAAPAVK